MRIVYKYILLVFAAVFSGVNEALYQCKGLPRVVFQSINVLFTRFWGWYLVDFYKSRPYNFIINPVERWLPHTTILFKKSSFTNLQVTCVPRQDFLFDAGIADFGTRFKYPVLNRVPGDEINRNNLLVFFKSVGQFTNQFTGSNDSRCKFQRIRKNILNNDNDFRTHRELHNSIVNLFGGFIKTNAYRAAS